MSASHPHWATVRVWTLVVQHAILLALVLLIEFGFPGWEIVIVPLVFVDVWVAMWLPDRVADFVTDHLV